MNEPRTLEIPERWRVMITLAQDCCSAWRAAPPAAAPTSTRTVVRHLSDELARAEPGREFDALLGAFPAAAELYENLQYAQAGLCRHPLEASLNSELLARQALAPLHAEATGLSPLRAPRRGVAISAAGRSRLTRP